MKIKQFVLSAFLFIGNTFYASDMLGLLSQVIVSGGSTSFSNAPYFFSKATYTNGGLTISFPSGLFPQDPYVFIFLHYTGNLGFISRYTYSAYNKSVSGVTIKVYDALGLEIGSNLVDVYIFAASQDPNGESILVN